MTSIKDCRVIELPRIKNRAGNITPVQGIKDIPFKIKRLYYLYDVPGGAARGGHAHKELQQLIVAASGSFDVIIDDGTEKKVIRLSQPYIGLTVVPGIWRELSDFSSGSICLVLASDHYNENDYIRNYQEFINWKL